MPEQPFVPSLCKVIFPTSGSGRDAGGDPVTVTHAPSVNPVQAAAEIEHALDAAVSPENCFIGTPVAALVNDR